MVYGKDVAFSTLILKTMANPSCMLAAVAPQLPQSLLTRIQSRTGLSIAVLQQETLWQKRIRLQKATGGQSLRFIDCFPLVGRRSLQPQHLIASSELNRQIDARLGR